MKMPRESSKCKWEKERRDRLKEAFNLLKKLLPSYDPAINLSQIEIIRKSTEHIQELRKKVDELLSSGSKKIEGEEIKKLRERVKKLLNRNEQLCALLKNAGISVPSVYGMVKKFKPPLPWANKISSEQADFFQKTEQEKENKPAGNKVKAAKTKKSKNIAAQSKRKKVINIEKHKSKLSRRKGLRNGLNTTKNVIVLQQPITTQPYYIISNVNSSGNIIRTTTNSTVITNSTLLTNPLVSTCVKPTNVLTRQNSALSTLGPGTLVLSNGTVIPLLPNVPTIPQIANAVPIQQQSSILFMLPKTTNASDNLDKKIVYAKSKGLHHIKPKICNTRTTQINKVPIPALTSRYSNTRIINSQIKTEIKKKDSSSDGDKRSAPPSNETSTDKPTPKRQEIELSEENKAKKIKLDNVIEQSGNTVIENTSGNVEQNSPILQELESSSVENARLQESLETCVPNKIVENLENTENPDKTKRDSLSVAKNIMEVDSLKITGDKPNLNTSNLNIHIEPKDTIEEVKLKKPDKPEEKQLEINNEMKTLELNLSHSDLSNDIFASLQVPTGGQNPESTSPTAAFLLAFPLVSSLTGVKVTEVSYDDNSESQRGTPNLLQIGTIDSTKPTQTESLTPNLLNLDNLSFFSAKDICGNFYTSFENNASVSKTINSTSVSTSSVISYSNFQTVTSTNSQGIKTYSTFENKDLKSATKETVHKNSNKQDLTLDSNKSALLNNTNTNSTVNAKKFPQGENLNHGNSVPNFHANFNQGGTNVNLNTPNVLLMNNSSKIVSHNTINTVSNNNNKINSSIHHCSNNSDNLIQNNSNRQNCSNNNNNTNNNNNENHVQNIERSSLTSGNNNNNTVKTLSNFDRNNIHTNVSVNNSVVHNSSTIMCPNNENYHKPKHNPISYNQTLQQPKSYTQCNNFQNPDTKIISSNNNLTYISKNYPDPLYTNCNTYYNKTENQNYYKKNTAYYPINYENYPDYRKNNTISQFNSTNYYYGTNSYNKEKCVEVTHKTTNNSNVNQQRGPINWMTTPDNRQSSLTDYSSLSTFPSKENEFNYAPTIYPTNSIVANTTTQSSYFNTHPVYSSSDTTTNETKKVLDLPLVHSMNTFNQRNDLVEENQFSWSPTKMPQFLDPPQSFSSTLTNLIGDLALGNSTSFIEQKTDKYLKDNNQRPKEATRRSKTAAYESHNFLSVSQLVDHNKPETPARTSNRRNSGSRSNNKNNANKAIKRSNKSQDPKDALQNQNYNNKLEGGDKFVKNNQMKHFNSQNSDIYHTNDNTVKSRAVAKSSYSAEALIGHHLHTESLHQKSKNNQSVASYPPTTKPLPVPPFLSENILPYFPSVDIPQDNAYNQNQNYHQSTSFSHNFTTFQNNTYNNSFIPTAPPITTTYLPSNNFIHDIPTNDYISENINVCPNKDSKQYSHKNVPRIINTPIQHREDKNNIPNPSNSNNANCSSYRKNKRKINPENAQTVPNFVDFPFLSVPGSINSPILPDDFHSHTSFIPPPPPTPSQFYPCKNPLYTKQNPDLTAGPLLSLPPPVPPPVTRSIQHPEISPSLNTTGTSLTNFNLSTIFPEINKVGFTNRPALGLSYINCATTQYNQ